MKINYEGLKLRLKERLDTAIEVAKCRTEVLKERNLEDDDTLSWYEKEFIEKTLNFECASYIDKLYDRP